jgi:predicted peptidase
MKRLILLSSVLAIGAVLLECPAAAASAAAPNPQDPQYQATGDQKRTYAFPGTGESIAYHLYVPAKWNKSAKLPLVIVLHGANQSPDTPFQRGDGVLARVAEERGYIAAAVTGYRSYADFNNPFPLVPAPRPEGASSAAPANGKAKTGPPAPTAEERERSEQDVLNVADVVAAEYNADRSRIYLMGNSTGGGGTWYLGQKYPERWAAISPSAAPAAPDRFPYDRLKNLPVLVVHGDHDQTRSYDASVKMVQLAKDHGVKIELITVKDGEHTTAWTMVVPQIFDFFDKQRGKKD